MIKQEIKEKQLMFLTELEAVSNTINRRVSEVMAQMTQTTTVEGETIRIIREDIDVHTELLEDCNKLAVEAEAILVHANYLSLSLMIEGKLGGTAS